MRKISAAVLALVLGGLLYFSNVALSQNQDPYPCPPSGCGNPK